MIWKSAYNSIVDYIGKHTAKEVLNTIEYLVLIVSQFAKENEISELEAYNYLKRYGTIGLWIALAAFLFPPVCRSET